MNTDDRFKMLRALPTAVIAAMMVAAMAVWAATSPDGCVTVSRPSGRVIDEPDDNGTVTLSMKAAAVNGCEREKNAMATIQGLDKDGYAIEQMLLIGSVPAKGSVWLTAQDRVKASLARQIVSWQVSNVLDQ